MDRNRNNIPLFKEIDMKIPLSQSKLCNGLSTEIQEYNTDLKFS